MKAKELDEVTVGAIADYLANCLDFPLSDLEIESEFVKTLNESFSEVEPAFLKQLFKSFLNVDIQERSSPSFNHQNFVNAQYQKYCKQES